MPPFVRVSGVLAALALAVLCAGCGGGDGGTTTSAGSTTTATTGTTTTPANKPTVVTAKLTAAAAVPKGPAGGTGTASVTLDVRKSRACWTLNVNGIGRALSAHVHAGGRGDLGDVVIPLGDTFSRKGCVLTGRKVLRDVAAAPGDYSVDVHSEKNLSGALRGQLRLDQS